MVMIFVFAGRGNQYLNRYIQGIGSCEFKKLKKIN